MKFNFAIFALAGAVAVVAQSTASNNGTTSAAGSSSSVDSSTSAASSTSATSSSTDAPSSSAAASTSAAASSSAVAQDTASAAAPYPTSSSGSSGSTFQVPSGISDSCSTFLQNLDQAKEVQACVSPALDALQGANPTIDNVCAKVASSSCSETAYYNFLTYFTSNCTNELITSPNADVNAIFDSLYVALPFQKAVCTKDTITGKWCAQRGSNSTAGSPGASNAAQTPLSDSKGYPDASAFSSNNILFLGYTPDQDQSTLCTSCLQKVLAIFFGHEGKRPYPSGLQNSPLVSVQNPLFAAVKQKCPADFVSGAISNVVPDPASVNAATAFTPAKGVAVFFALLAGVIAL